VPMPHKYLLKEFEEFARSAAEPEAMMQRISQRVHLHIPRYNWVGFYLIDKNDSSALVLDLRRAALPPRQRFPGMKGYAAPPLPLAG
jgi:L-methionine (R)-S-oxide reductase